MAGMTTQLNLQADHAGTYQGLSAQFSGPGFSDMRFTLVASSPEDFRQWVEQTRSSGAALDWAGYTTLSKPAHAGEALSFSQVDPAIFHRVAMGDVSTRWSTEEAR
jgi:cytochrome o ubiquinol oxidase subunit 2